MYKNKVIELYDVSDVTNSEMCNVTYASLVHEQSHRNVQCKSCARTYSYRNVRCELRNKCRNVLCDAISAEMGSVCVIKSRVVRNWVKFHTLIYLSPLHKCPIKEGFLTS